ncbi:hypothetical protein D3C78_1275600 [compost metagenome]
MIVHIRQDFGGPASRFVVAQHGNKLIGQRGRGAVEQREIAALMPEEPDRRKHAVYRRHQTGGEIMAQIDITLSQRQEIEQQIQHDPWVTGNMPAIGQNLAFHFLSQLHSVPVDARQAGRHGDRGHGKRDPNPQPRFAVRRMSDDSFEIPHVKGKAFQETAVKTGISLV